MIAKGTSKKGAGRKSGRPLLEYPFHVKGGEMRCEGVKLSAIAREAGSPVFVYSAGRIRAAFNFLKESFRDADPLLAYSLKANSTRKILELLNGLGSAFDVTSAGELQRALRAGAKPGHIIFAGVGKTDEELELAIRKKIFLFNVESPSEARHINAIAGRLGRRASIALRVNPGVDAHTHRYITTGKKENKFGIDIEFTPALLKELFRLPHLNVIGLHAHIGSMIMLTDRHGAALDKLLTLREVFAEHGRRLEVINIGGGYGIDYENPDNVIDISAIAKSVVPKLRAAGVRMIAEPGRFIVAPAGALVTRVTFIKEGVAKNFAIVDSGMNVVLRPALYEAFHRIEVVQPRRAKPKTYDVVGPICESSDFLGKDRALPALQEGDLLAVMDTGAYCASMASQYNSHPRPPEVLVDGAKWQIIRRRETLADIVRSEV